MIDFSREDLERLALKMVSLLDAALAASSSYQPDDLKNRILSGKMPLSQLRMLARDFGEMAALAQQHETSVFKQLVQEEPLVQRLVQSEAKEIKRLLKQGRIETDDEWQLINAYLANTKNSKHREALGQICLKYEEGLAPKST